MSSTCLQIILTCDGNILYTYLLTYACYPSSRNIGHSQTLSIQLFPVQSFPVAIYLFHACFNSRHSVSFSLTLFRFPSGIHARACLVTQFGDFRNVCHIHSQRLFLLSSSDGSWFVLYHSMLLPMVLGQQILRILRGKLSTNTCTF